MQTQAATLRTVALPHAGLATDAVLVAGGAAFVALAAQASFHLGFTPVPITGQTGAALLVGATLGSVRGAASLILYLLLGLGGLPVYSGHDHGWSTFSGATGGYIVGFVVAAALVGFLAEGKWDRAFSSSLSAMLLGSITIYAFGLLWLHHDLHVSWATTFEDGLYPFIVGDLAKVFIAALALPSAWRLVRRFSS
jgi:biotin transport system substrate-specific component